jgi:hypothetical protein
MNEVLILVVLFLIIVFFNKVINGIFDGIFGFIKLIFTGAGCLGSLFGYIIAVILIIVILVSLF